MRDQLICIALAVLALVGCRSTSRPADEEPLRDLAWLAGSWRSVSEDAPQLTVSEEHWTHPAGATMFGSSRTITGSETVFFEHLRIETSDGEIVYIAQPRGRSPGVAFTLIEQGDRRAVFENPEHDFPQRIIYERHGDLLTARIEGQQNGSLRVETWSWKRVND